MDEYPYRAKEAVSKLLTEYNFHTMLDVGCGDEKIANVFRENDVVVDTVDIKGRPTYKGMFPGVKIKKMYDCFWASHVLEHQLNVGMFLHMMKLVTRKNGVFCLTVPPLKHEIVGGHYTLWNGGLLLYNLVMAGVDCRDARVKQYGYNISVIARNNSYTLTQPLNYDRGDIEILAKYFPKGYDFQGFDGNIQELNW